MCERCNEPANWIDPRNKPVVNYPEIQQDWSSYYEPVPVMDHDYTVSSESDYDCCSEDAYDRLRARQRANRARPSKRVPIVYQEPKRADIDWLTVISILGVIAFFAVMVYGQMKQQEQVSICYEQNQSEVSELC